MRYQIDRQETPKVFILQYTMYRWGHQEVQITKSQTIESLLVHCGERSIHNWILQLRFWVHGHLSSVIKNRARTILNPQHILWKQARLSIRKVKGFHLKNIPLDLIKNSSGWCDSRIVLERSEFYFQEGIT